MKDQYRTPLDHDTQAREAFHDWLESQGFRRPVTPLGRDGQPTTYPGSHLQDLWQCWAAATLHERSQVGQPAGD